MTGVPRDPAHAGEKVVLPLSIPVHNYLQDHHFEGKIILPAVEILQRLAASVLAHRPGTFVRRMCSASFERLLVIESGTKRIEALHELKAIEKGRISSSLMKEGLAGKTGIGRTKTYAQVDFAAGEQNPSAFPAEAVPTPAEAAFPISASRLYTDLVPFGPAFRNLKGDILLSEKGGWGKVYGTDHPAASGPLGSPFPFDGALHIACAWGQRFRGQVLFPTGFTERSIVKPTLPGETYRCCVIPAAEEAGKCLSFNIWIHDGEGSLREYAEGVRMQDISGGRVMPPAWVRAEDP